MLLRSEPRAISPSFADLRKIPLDRGAKVQHQMRSNNERKQFRSDIHFPLLLIKISIPIWFNS